VFTVKNLTFIKRVYRENPNLLTGVNKTSLEEEKLLLKKVMVNNLPLEK